MDDLESVSSLEAERAGLLGELLVAADHEVPEKPLADVTHVFQSETGTAEGQMYPFFQVTSFTDVQATETLHLERMRDVPDVSPHQARWMCLRLNLLIKKHTCQFRCSTKHRPSRHHRRRRRFLRRNTPIVW